MAKGGLRIRHEGPIAGFKTSVYFVDEDGNETDVSNYVRDIEAEFHAGAVVGVKLTMFLKDWETDVPLDAVKVAQHFHDVTPLGAPARKFAAA